MADVVGGFPSDETHDHKRLALTDLQGLTTARSARDRLQKTLDAMPSVGQALLKFK